MRFPGIIPAATTPFDSALAVDSGALSRNLTHLVEAGVGGVVVNGTMGEGGQLEREERRAVVATAVQACAGRVPVTVGVSASSPRAATAYATDAVAEGADALMLLPPLLYAADERELVAFYAEVAEATGLPIMAYNNPHASGSDLEPDTLLRLADAVDAVVAIKECSGDARRIAALLEAGRDLEVLVGGDDWALEGFAAGATGWVSGVAVVAPADCVALHERVEAGDLDGAREIYRRLLPLARFDMTPKLVQYFKAALDAVGETGGPCRPPRLALADDERDALARALEHLRGRVAA
jgi:4-hydroxy-tetrahydrodipicolinate synthase